MLNVIEEEHALVVPGEQVHALLRQTLGGERNHEVTQVAVAGARPARS